MALTYGDYLKLDELLRLQEPRSRPPEHDETLFIVVHQVYELWFKQQLHELDRLQELLRGGATFAALLTLRRMLTILKVMVHQTDVLATLTPVSFGRFRGYLQAASGFQSAQFRELEFACGLKDPRHLERHPPGSPARERLARRLAAPTLGDAFRAYLAARGHRPPPPQPDPATREDPAFQAWFRPVYAADPEVVLVTERLVDFDEGFQEWRYRHVKMVERTIGDKPGTGGSAGVAYLKGTLFRPFFPDLWRFRTEL